MKMVVGVHPIREITKAREKEKREEREEEEDEKIIKKQKLKAQLRTKKISCC
jgi:hypothetical protein